MLNNKEVINDIYQILGKFGEDREDIKSEFRKLCKLYENIDDGASVDEQNDDFYCSTSEEYGIKCQTQCLGCAGLQNQVKNDLNSKPSVIKNPNCDCDKSDDGYCTNLLCKNFYPQ